MNRNSEKSFMWVWPISALLIIKPLIFYNLMGIRSNLILLWIITSAIMFFMFASFKRSWIPFIIYFLLSILMFADITFNGYFNGYLSVDSMGSAKYLPEVLDVIKEVVHPKFWLIFYDIPLLALALWKVDIRPLKTRWYIRMLPLFIIVFMVTGSVSSSSILRSAGNLEFFSFHSKDIIETYTGFGKLEVSAMEASSYEVLEDREKSLFGIGEGRNLIVIQMEALQNFVINMDYEGVEITPVLNSLTGDDGSIYFDNYYMQIAAGNTSDAEFATNNSIYGSEKSYTYELYKENTFRGLPILLKERGYNTIAMHGYEGSFWSRKDMYPAQGFDEFIDAEGYKPTVEHGWGILDEEFYAQSADYLEDMRQPFYSFLVSLSNHTPFTMEEEYCRLELKEEHKATRFGNYLNSTAYSDYALGVFIDALKEKGLYDNSIIAIYGDHFGLAEKDEDNEVYMTGFLGKPYRFDDMANIPLIIHIPGQDINRTMSIAGGQIDFLPTIAYIMGFEELDTVFLGRNLFTARSGFVAQTRYAPLGSFITDDVMFLMAPDRVFENGRAWNTKTGEDVSIEGLRSLYEKSVALVLTSEKYLEEDYFAEQTKIPVGEEKE